MRARALIKHIQDLLDEQSKQYNAEVDFDVLIEGNDNYANNVQADIYATKLTDNCDDITTFHYREDKPTWFLRLKSGN